MAFKLMSNRTPAEIEARDREIADLPFKGREVRRGTIALEAHAIPGLTSTSLRGTATEKGVQVMVVFSGARQHCFADGLGAHLQRRCEEAFDAGRTPALTEVVVEGAWVHRRMKAASGAWLTGWELLAARWHYTDHAGRTVCEGRLPGASE